MANTMIFNTILREYRADINDLSLELLCVKSVMPPSNYADLSKFLHIHSYVEMFACISGRLEITLADGSVVCEAGDIAVIPAGCRHIANRRAQKDVTVGFVGHRCEKYGAEPYFFRLSELLCSDKPRVYRSCPELCRIVSEVKDAAGSETLPSGAIYPVLRLAEVLEHISRLPYETVGVGGLQDSNGISRDVGRFFIIEEIINTRFTQPLNVEQVASALYVTRRHLDRIVKEHYGCTLKELVTEKRLQLACRLLEETDATVTDVAERSGFANGTVMRSVFQKRLGATPGEYRKNKKSKAE